jgi:hypothetical protein
MRCRRTFARSSRSASGEGIGLLPENAAIGLDAAMATDLTDALEAAGFTVADGQKGEVVAIGQGFRLMSAIVGLARKLKFGGAVHSGSRLMAWCVGNAKEEKGRQSVMINKYAAGAAKIDPLMAAFNATKLLETNPVAGRAGCRTMTGRRPPPREHSQLHAALADRCSRRRCRSAGTIIRRASASTMTTSLALSAAYACTRLIAGTYASLPVTVTSSRAGTTTSGCRPRSIRSTAAAESPNARTRPTTSSSSAAPALELKGNMLALKDRTGDRVTSLLPMPWDETHVRRLRRHDRI